MDVYRTDEQMSFEKINGTAACFTGHRIQKLPWGRNESDPRCSEMKAQLCHEIEKAILRGYDTFYCGMATGFDMICAEAVLAFRQKYPQIKLIGALPCRNQDDGWPETDRARYRRLLAQLDGIRCIYDEYCGPRCMHERNRFMVDNSSLIIALYDGRAGGTRNTLNYARSKGLECVLLSL